VIDKQGDRASRRRPAAGDQLIGVVRASTRNLKGQVEVEVALSPGPARAQPAVAALGAGTEASGAHEQPRGEPPRLDPQLRIGGRAEVGEQRDGGVGVRAQEIMERLLVEPADGR
jgi:hypothetical protein